MAYYAFQTAFKSGVIGGSWSTPYGTRFFVRWGDTSLKVPMAALRQEYEAWEKFRRERHPEPEPEPPKPAPLASFSSSSFDWADDVEQEFFSSTGNDSDIPANSNLDITLGSKPDTDLVDSPIVAQVIAEGVFVVGAGTTLCAILEEGEEEGVAGEDDTGDLDSIDLSDPTDSDSNSLDDSISSNDSDSTLLDDNDATILDDNDSTYPADSSTTLDDPTSLTPPSTDIDTTGTNFSLHMVEDETSTSDTSHSNTDTDTATDPASTAKKLFDTTKLLATAAGLLNLNTYAAILDTAARACAAAPPFWLHDLLGDLEMVLV